MHLPSLMDNSVLPAKTEISNEALIVAVLHLFDFFECRKSVFEFFLELETFLEYS